MTPPAVNNNATVKTDFIPDNEAKAKKIAQAKAAILKMRVEQYFTNMLHETNERTSRHAIQMNPTQCVYMTIYRLEHLEEHLKNISITEQREAVIAKFKAKEAEFLRSKRVRLTCDDFKTIRVIGRGAFGIVRIHLCTRHAR